MENEQKKNEKKDENKKKGFWACLMEKLDKQILEKANQPCCKGGSKESKCC